MASCTSRRTRRRRDIRRRSRRSTSVGAPTLGARRMCERWRGSRGGRDSLLSHRGRYRRRRRVEPLLRLLPGHELLAGCPASHPPCRIAATGIAFKRDHLAAMHELPREEPREGKLVRLRVLRCRAPRGMERGDAAVLRSRHGIGARRRPSLTRCPGRGRHTIEHVRTAAGKGFAIAFTWVTSGGNKSCLQ